MAAEYLEDCYEKLRRDIQITHESWNDFIWDFIYSDGIVDIEKATPTLLENMKETEKTLHSLLNEISSI